MKKQFFRYLSGIIPAVALFLNANAQIAKADLELNLKEYVFNEAKANLAPGGEIGTTAVNTKAVKDFTRSFKNAGNTKWFEIKDGFVAKFTENGIETKAYYYSNGRWNSTIRTYGEDKLPKEIRHIVKSTYYDYNIFLVQEVTVGEKTAYLVKIQDAGTYKTIRVIDGEMDVYEDYKKG